MIISPSMLENPVESGFTNAVITETEEVLRTSPRPSNRGSRNPSPAPSCTSSSISAVTTVATLSSRSSLSSCRPSGSGQSSSRRGSCSGGRFRLSSRSISRRSSAATRDGFLPPATRNSSGRRWRRNSRDRSCSREVDRRRVYPRRSGKDYASEASFSRGRRCGRGESGSGYSRRGKRSRSPSMGRRTRSKVVCGDVQCPRCLERCRANHDEKITRTLPMEYWVRTPACKAAKCRHMEYMDEMTYSREQFIEEFVEKWAAENHPHVVEWECDNNEGDRSIDWYHVHVFFRLGCEDKTGVPRDPSSEYRGPCGTPACTVSNEDSKQRGGDISEEVIMTNCEKPLNV